MCLRIIVKKHMCARKPNPKALGKYMTLITMRIALPFSETNLKLTNGLELWLRKLRSVSDVNLQTVLFYFNGTSMFMLSRIVLSTMLQYVDVFVIDAPNSTNSPTCGNPPPPSEWYPPSAFLFF